MYDQSDRRRHRRQNKNQIIDLGTADEADKIIKQKGPKKPSVYMKEIIRLNFVDLARKIDDR